MKKKLIIVIFLFSLLFVYSCAYSPSGEIIKKGTHEVSVSLGVPVYSSFPIVGVMITPFPAIGYKYGITDDLNFFIRNYPIFFFMGILFIDTGIVGRIYSLSPYLHLTGLLGTQVMAKLFEGIQFYGNTGLFVIIGENNKSHLYLGGDIVVFPIRNSLDVNGNLKAGGIIKLNENWGLALELSLNSVGRTTFVNTGFQGIGFPTIYIGASYKFGDKEAKNE
jgi:hypothetical protein